MACRRTSLSLGAAAPSSEPALQARLVEPVRIVPCAAPPVQHVDIESLVAGSSTRTGPSKLAITKPQALSPIMAIAVGVATVAAF